MIHLVGGLEHLAYFPRNIGLLIIPIDFHIFQRGGLTTNQENYSISALVFMAGYIELELAVDGVRKLLTPPISAIVFRCKPPMFFVNEFNGKT